MNPAVFLIVMTLLCWPFLKAQAESPVQAKFGINDNWQTFATRTLADLPVSAAAWPEAEPDQFGGWKSSSAKATGFFYATNLDGRWWLIDPAGGLFLEKGVTDVNMLHGAGSRNIWQEKFGGESNWVTDTTSLLRTNGFNGIGAWSDTAHLRQASRPLAYTRILDFMAGYGQQRGGTYQQSGHLGFPKDCIFVFDPDFETYCDTQARKLAGNKNDPWLLGYFSDNELPFRREALKNYLALPPTDSGHQAALDWLRARYGKNAVTGQITAQDEKDFLAFVADRYFRIVSAAIKKHDPNHLYLGSRFNGRVLDQPEVFKAAGPYVDVVSVNYYRAWTPSLEKLAGWEHESGKPVLITEWYAKAEDSGMANTGGAGWIVKTQHDRGLFYQNFTLALLQSKNCVGWDWFKYADNDPTNLKADPSNRDANKGIINLRYEPYQALLEAMQPVNENAYSLIRYFDRATAQTGGDSAAHL